MNISILLVLKITRNTRVAKRGFSLLLKVSVNENFSTLLDFVFFFIFGVSGS